jgi:hypothetical protein
MSLRPNCALTLFLAAISYWSSACQGQELFQPRTPIVQARVAALEADFLLVTRVAAIGSTDCLFVRYVASQTHLRFFVLHSEAAFNVRFFPLRARGMVGSISPDGIRLRQSENQFDEFRKSDELAPVIPMKDGSLFYDPKEAVESPAQFIRRGGLNYSVAGEVAAGSLLEAQQKDMNFRAICDPEWIMTEEQVQIDNRNISRTRYDYKGDAGSLQLKSLTAELYPQRFDVENRAGIISTDAATRAFGDRMLHDDPKHATIWESQLRRLKSVPYVHHNRGRVATVQFEARMLSEGKVQTIPCRFSVQASLNAPGSQVLREAHLLSVRSLSKAEAEAQMAEDFFPRMPLLDAVVKWTARHSSSMFRGAEVDRDLAAFRQFVVEEGYSGSDAPLQDRIRVAGRNLDIEVYRHDRAVILDWLNQYLAVASGSPLKKFQPELIVWLLRRIDACGTSDVYKDIILSTTDHFAKSMQPDEILDSMEHTVQLGFGPLAFFHWSVTTLSIPNLDSTDPSVIVSSPREDLTLEQRYRRAFLASRLLPSLRAIDASPTAGRSGFLGLDGDHCKAVFTKTEIEETSAALLKEAKAAISGMNGVSVNQAKELLARVQSNLDPKNMVLLPDEQRK